MRALRRLFQVVALVGTLLVGIVAVALIVSQTSWFRDWLRRFIVRESAQYVNGDLSIGRLGGNLFFGVQLRDVALRMDGERVIAIKDVEVDYSVFRIISSGVVLDGIRLNEPYVLVERTERGWNLGRLVKEQEREADREGPARPIALQSIEITDAQLAIRDQAVGTSGVRLPDQITDLDLVASFEYEPVRYSLTLDRASFRATSPDLQLGELTGKIAVRDDNVYIDNLRVATAESSLHVDGVVEDYLKTPIVKVVTSGHVSMPEIGRIVPAAASYRLHPRFEIKANGPAERLGLDLNVRSEAGNVRGQLTADVRGPRFGAEGEVDVERLNLAPLLRDPEQRSDITGRARLDIEVAEAPAQAPITDRMSGTFTFTGPRVVAAGYQASNVKASGRIAGPRISLDARAQAYGGSATAKGFIVTPSGSRPLSFDLAGSASNVNLRGLPAATGAPDLETRLAVAQYRVRGTGKTIEGNARLNRSTIEGATIESGTVATFSVAPRAISYSAKGAIADLDIERLGRALEIDALEKPEYASNLNGSFDVRGTLPRNPQPARRAESTTLAEMTLEASGTLKNSEILGGRLPELTYQASIANGGLTGRAQGRFEGFDPAVLSGREQVKGDVSGTVNANFAIADLTAPITPESIRADGQVTLTESSVGGLRVDSLEVDAAYANQIAQVKTFTLSSPDVKAEVSGQVALDETSQSDLQYRVEAINLPELARLAGQEGIGGSATVEGRITGNRAALTTTGTLDGSNLSYQENNALDLNSTYTVTVPQLDFARAKVEAKTEAEFIKAAGLQINELTATTTYADKTIEFTTSIKEQTRELDATGTVILHPDHQELHLPELALRTEGIEWRMAPGGDAAIQYGQDRVDIENVRLVSGNQSLDVSGTIALKEDAPSATLDVRAENVDLQQVERLLLIDRGLGGTLSANARITGTTAQPAVDGRVEIRNGAFEDYKYESLVADVDYAGRRVTLDATLTQSPTELITVSGSAPMSLFRASEQKGHVAPVNGEAVDLRVKSTALGLGVIQSFVTQVGSVKGTIEADIRVTGSGDDPHLEGHVDIRNGAFEVPTLGTAYTGLNTRIDLTPDLVKLQQFDIRDAHGEPLSVSGELAVHERKVGAVNISIQSDNFELIDNELGDVGVDSDIRISGELRRPKVGGRVRIEAGRLEVDRILALFYDPYATEALPGVTSPEKMVEGLGSAEEATKAALKKAEKSAAPPETQHADAPPAPGGAFEAVELDMQLVIPDNLVLRGRELRPGGPRGIAVGNINMTIGGDVQVRKPAGEQVRLTGTVQTIRGTYEFQGRRFNLERGGRLRFVGDTEINPILDIRANREIPNTGVEARIHVTGTARQPELQLSSNPPLDESDVLALIVFNRPVNELGTGERSSLAATAGGIATGFIATPLGESIGRALDVDLFEITTTTEEGELGAGLTLGQQIGDRAFIKLRQQFGDRSSSEFMIEYQLASFLRLQASAAPETTGVGNRLNQRRVERGGIDLIFFFSY